MSNVLLGSATATEQPIRYGWSPDRGSFITRAWEGPRAAVRALIPSLAIMKWSYDYQEKPGGLARLEAQSSTDLAGGISDPVKSDSSETWELAPNVVQKDLLSWDGAAISSLTAEEVAQIRKYLKEDPTSNAAIEWIDSAAQEPVYVLMKSGVEHAQVTQPILRRTVSVPSNKIIPFNFTNTGKVLSTATLLSTEGVPADMRYPIQQFTTGTLTRGDGTAMSYGWLKAWPTLSVQAFSRRELQIEYQYGLWADLIYGAAV